MEARGRLLQKERRKRIYLIIMISWSIRISKKKTIVDIFRLINYLSYLFKSSCHSILNFPSFYLNYSFTFFEYGGLIVSLRYIFISIFFLLDIFIVLFIILFTFEARSSMLLQVIKKSLFRHFDFNLLIIYVIIIDIDRTLIIINNRQLFADGNSLLFYIQNTPHPDQWNICVNLIEYLMLYRDIFKEGIETVYNYIDFNNLQMEHLSSK